MKKALLTIIFLLFSISILHAEVYDLGGGGGLPSGCAENEIPKKNVSGAWACSADSTGGTPTFDTVATGSNTTATLTVGTGGTLTYSGSGIINATRFLGIATVDATEFGYINGVTSAIQTQIDAKAPVANPTFTGTVTGTFSGNITGNVTGNVSGTAGSLASNPTDCTAGQFATGIAASGNLTCDTPAGSGDVTGPSASTDGELPLFSLTTGKIIKRSNTLNGIVKLTSGVVSMAVADTDYLTPTTAGTTYVANALFDANTIIFATSDNTPAALTVAEQRVIGRVTSGAIDDLTIDADLSTVSANDDTLPSAKSTKSYTDGKFGTLTNTKWCTSNGTTVSCTEDAPVESGDITGVLDDTTGEVPVLSDAPAAFASTDTTPDVSGGTIFRTANASGTTISDFDAGGGSLLDGQMLIVIVNDANTTFDFTSAGLEGHTDDFLASNGDILYCVYATTDTQWHCIISHSINDTDMAAEDFGGFTCTGAEDGCNVDGSSIGGAEVKQISAFTDELCLTYEATGDGFETISCGSPASLVRDCKTWFDPVEGDAPILFFAGDWDIIDVYSFCSGGTSVVFKTQECDDAGTSCADMFTNITCTAAAALATKTGTFTEATCGASYATECAVDNKDAIKLVVGTVTGSVDYLTICVDKELH